ncbi:MAG: amino acid adenylation domain-containing protein [Bacteroidota bacterium]
MEKPERSLSERLAGLNPEQLRALLRKGRDDSAPKPGKPVRMERNHEGIYPMSKAQERMWFLHTLSEGEGIYNNPVAIRMFALNPIDMDVFVRSLGSMMERHEILRTTFHLREGKPVQQIHTTGKPEMQYEDLRHLPLGEREIAVRSKALEHGKITIPIDQLPLVRFTVLHLCDLEYMLLINPHHIISDGWSNALFAKEISLTYAAFENKEPSPFPVPDYHYVDFVKWEKEWIASPDCKLQLEFWKAQLADLPEPLRLPLDFQRPAIKSYRGNKEVRIVNAAEADIIRQFCQGENITQFQLLFGAFALLISKYSGQKEIVIGVPVARRNQASFHQTLGLFINTLPLRVSIDDKISVNSYLNEIKTYCQQAFLRQELPFEKLIEEVNPDRNLSSNPVFQVHFVYQNIPSLYSVKGLTVKPESIDYSYSKFDLNFWIEEANHEMILSVTYPTDIFLPQTIQNLLHNYKILLNSVISHPEENIGDLSYFSEIEKSYCKGVSAVFAENTNAEPTTWLGEFNAQVRLSPDLKALRDIRQEISFRELDKASDHIAHMLIRNGVRKNDFVGILLPREASLILTILGVFKAGAAYVPLDYNIPAARINFMAKDAGLKLIVSTEELSGSAASCGIPVLKFSEMMADQRFTMGVTENELPGPGDLAYVIYTSGTTGTPKGVCVGSDQLLNYSKSVWRRMNLTAGDSCATISSIAADLGNTMIFPPLIHGGEVVIVPDPYATDATQLSEWFERHPVDCLKIVPSHLLSLLHTVKAERLLPKKLLMMGGEKCTAEIVAKVRSLAPSLRIINHYGPTEATIGSLTNEIHFSAKAGSSGFPIGLPLDNTSVFIVDNNFKLVPKGIPGEIILSGKNIAEGYLNQPEMTAEKFAVNPFYPEERIYFTGDLGKMNEDGSVVFLGRKDHQLKIRGYRVEILEIENTLNRHPSIEQSLVIVPEDHASINFVEAAIVIRQGSDFDEQAIRQWLSYYVPTYMIPSKFIVADHFPLTSNGKVDLKELRLLLKRQGTKSKMLTAPRDLTELMLLNIFKEILNQEDLGIEDNFFDSGGHSLLAIQLFAAIDKVFRIPLPLATLFQRGNVMSLAELIRKSNGIRMTNSLVPIRMGAGKKHLYLVHPAGGNVLCYFELAKEMGHDFDVYGLQSMGLNNKKVDTVSDIARYYLDEIQLPENTEDVIFAGWSMGALIAFEMARQVKAQSGKCPRLMIIDQLAPVEESIETERTPIDNVDRMLAFAGKVEHLAGHPLGITDASLRGKSSEIQSEVFLTAFKSVNLVPPDISLQDFHGYLELMIHHNEITSRCRPGTYEGKTMLIRADDSLPMFDNQLPMAIRTADLGWERLIEGNFTIENIPGNHVSIMAQPHVKNLALALMKWVESGASN